MSTGSRRPPTCGCQATKRPPRRCSCRSRSASGWRTSTASAIRRRVTRRDGEGRARRSPLARLLVGRLTCRGGSRRRRSRHGVRGREHLLLPPPILVLHLIHFPPLFPAPGTEPPLAAP